MAQAPRDQNFVPTLLGVSSADGTTPVTVYVDPTTHRLLVDFATAGGTVTSVSVVSANGFAGTVATATTTPAITLTTTVTGILQGNGTAISAASTTGSGAVVLANTPTLITPVLGAATGTSIVLSGSLTTGTSLIIEEPGAGTDTVTIDVPAALDASWTLTLPPNNGDSGQVLRTDGAGVTTWVTPAAGTVTSVTGTADRITSSGGATPQIDIAATYVGQATITTLGTITTGVWNAGAVTSSGLVTGTSFVPTSNSAPTNGLYLPAANTLGWAVNSTAELQLTSTAFSPATDGGNSLGTTALGWQNLFGNTGFVINIENSDWVATHTAGILTVGTGDLRVTTAGTNTASVVTVGGTQTLTSKTLTTPAINGATLNGTLTLTESTSIALDPAQGDGTWTGITRAGTAGATLAFGDLCYLASADSRWELTDADSATTSDRMLGMCVLAAASDGDPTVLLLMGNIQAASKFPALTIGSAVYIGESAGAIQVAIPTGADNVIRRVGYALTADEIYFNPSMDSQVTVA